MICINLYYERSNTPEEIARNPKGDSRKFACFLACTRKGDAFKDLLTLCAGLKPGTRVNQSGKRSTDVLFLPGPGHIAFPATFEGIVCSPLSGETNIYFQTKFEEMYDPKATVTLQNFMFVLMCAIESSWKATSKHPGMTHAQSALKTYAGWQKSGWRYGSGGSDAIALLNDVADAVYAEAS